MTETRTAPRSTRYYVAQHTDTVAKFVAAVAKHNAALAAFRNGAGPFPRPTSKASKHRAYDAASTVRRLLAAEGVDLPHASSVADLARTVGEATAWIFSTIDAEAVAEAAAR